MRGAAPGSRAMPVLGFGTCCRAGAKGRPLVSSAVAYLERGGRLLDTAFMYGNHRDVATAVRESGLAPGEVWITDKIQPSQMGYEKTQRAVDLSLKELQVLAVDLMLIHVPDGGREARVGSWAALVEAQRAGKVRHIGVSNFDRVQIQELVNATGVWPANNQIEFSPFSPPPVRELVAWMRGQGITVTAYGSLGHAGANLSQAAARAGAEALQRRYGKTAAQVFLRWGVDRGVAVVPGATSEEHIAENLDILDFSLTEQELSSLESNSKPEKWRWFHGTPGK
ncbi:unnamed protein product [Prorocentrum cordatum]|uniref:NADP-dependent oxidoreductase domain-containing protein n=1 Tax=Prorocentrum cordatum TaxID=2364126 RepID=A0ABN9R3M2_9DINO|nr:unnamed protein product [Polarella glacialis]